VYRVSELKPPIQVHVGLCPPRAFVGAVLSSRWLRRFGNEKGMAALAISS